MSVLLSIHPASFPRCVHKSIPKATLDATLYDHMFNFCLQIFQQKACPITFFPSTAFVTIVKTLLFLPKYPHTFFNSLSFRLSLAILALCSRFWPLTESCYRNFAFLSKFDYRCVSLVLIMVLSERRYTFSSCTTYSFCN